ncbi:hypothetical protein HDU77_004453 [Chytriomyces hyalinus]|nr:hypothetical protein HDU77_004453 [Chytriomyces hyalinus]
MALSADCAALAAMFPALYPITKTCCGVSGVVCVNGSVVALFLRSAGLSGPIPEKLSALASLNVLDLSSNRLFGPIPSSLESLKLQSIDLSHNILSGSVPKWLAPFGADAIADNCFNGQPSSAICALIGSASSQPVLIATTLMVSITTFTDIPTVISSTSTFTRSPVTTLVAVATNVTSGYNNSTSDTSSGGPSPGSVAGGIAVALVSIISALGFLYWYKRIRRRRAKGQSLDGEVDEFNRRVPPFPRDSFETNHGRVPYNHDGSKYGHELDDYNRPSRPFVSSDYSDRGFNSPSARTDIHGRMSSSRPESQYRI